MCGVTASLFVNYNSSVVRGQKERFVLLQHNIRHDRQCELRDETNEIMNLKKPEKLGLHALFHTGVLFDNNRGDV